MNVRFPTTADVAVIGAGPVGLTASLLLSQYGVSHIIIEERSEPTDHPQAHFIGTRSMEVFREVGGLDRSIRDAGTPLEEWRHYVYCTSLCHLPKASEEIRPAYGALLGATDHFPSGGCFMAGDAAHQVLPAGASV
jgi:2-polyprenyl-6-methoxyphenol hydroxylase-like FAD-dependent oxidoreductase